MAGSPSSRTADNYLIDLDHAVIIDVEATTSAHLIEELSVSRLLRPRPTYRMFDDRHPVGDRDPAGCRRDGALIRRFAQRDATSDPR